MRPRTVVTTGLMGFLLAVAPSSAGPGLTVAFEADEGYTQGSLGGQQGWTGDQVRPFDTLVLFIPEFSSNALWIKADGGFDGAFHLGASSPVFEPWPGRFTTAAQDIMIDQVSGADFLVQTVDSAAGAAVQVQFAFDRRLIVNGLDTGYRWSAFDPMTVTIEHDHLLGLASVMINASTVASGIDITGIEQIDQLQYGTDDAVSGPAASLFVDNISVVPEPSVLALLSWGAATLSQRRRRVISNAARRAGTRRSQVD